MGDGFLDEVEKAIDNFSPNKEEKINKKVERTSWQWQNNYYGREREREATLQRRLMVPASLRDHERVEHIDCDCGTHIIAKVVVEGTPVWAERHISDEYVYHDVMYCPRCSKMYKTPGKIKDLKVMMRN